MTIHIILQGKGGVGKSFIASLITQYLKQKSDNVLCIDTDPVNHTFSSYKDFNATQIKLLNEHNKINTRVFDDLVELLLAHDNYAVIDNGAATFIPLSSYMKENNLIEFLKQADKEIIIHTVLTGGQALDDTLIGLNALLDTNQTQVIVWENEYFGKIQKDGKKFSESKIYDKNKDKIKGIITIHKQNEDTFSKDIDLMTSNKLTFDEALNSSTFTIMPKQRLKIFQKSIFDQLDNIGI